MTETNTTDIFARWSEAQKELFEQWRTIYAQAMPLYVDPLKPLQSSALPLSATDFFAMWKQLFDRFSSMTASAEPGALSADVLSRMSRASEAFMSVNTFLMNVSQQLPAVFEAAGDEAKSREIFESWAKLYYESFEKLFGTTVSDTSKQNVDTWLNIVEKNQQASGLMVNPWKQAFPRMQEQAERALMKGDWEAAKKLHGIFREAYDETLGRMFRMPGFGLTKAQNESVRKAYDAVQRYHLSLPGFYEYFYETGLKALKEVFDRVQGLEVDEVTPETVRQFYRIWWSTNENHFFELFKSPDFVRTMNEVTAFGLKAKQRVDTLTAELCKAIDIPSNREFDQMAQVVHELRRKVRLQQKAIEELQKKLTNNRQREV
jgi:hypothetical protein